MAIFRRHATGIMKDVEKGSCPFVIHALNHGVYEPPRHSLVEISIGSGKLEWPAKKLIKVGWNNSLDMRISVNRVV